MFYRRYLIIIVLRGQLQASLAAFMLTRWQKKVKLLKRHMREDFGFYQNTVTDIGMPIMWTKDRFYICFSQNMSYL